MLDAGPVHCQQRQPKRAMQDCKQRRQVNRLSCAAQDIPATPFVSDCVTRRHPSSAVSVCVARLVKRSMQES